MERLKKFNYKKYIVYISFIIVLVGFSIILRDKDFLSVKNMMNILRQTSMISVAAVGMTFAISAGLIDLSIGGIIAMSALTTALLLKSTNFVIAVLGGMAVGILCGLFNGIIIAKVRIPAFLVTLGTSTIFGGIARIMTNLEA
ncbi:MAG: ABC transporter permease, partial [Pygmaiobacter sp.]